MARRGLYDHFGGGFARYSVDGEWHVPHFEKMLSDQALLARCYLDAARACGSRGLARGRPRHAGLRGSSPAPDPSGYAASLDADAGGVEGSHITWTPEEVAATLGEAERGTRSLAALRRWRIEEPRRLRRPHPSPVLPRASPSPRPTHWPSRTTTLIAHRNRRVQPSRDDKVILEWNAMLASAFLRSGRQRLRGTRSELLAELRASHFDDGVWWRTAHRRAHATASDIAWLIDAHVDAFELSGDDQWLDEAATSARYLLEHHWDGPVPTPSLPSRGRGVFSQSDLVADLPTRPKEIFDGATPSAHAVATRALARLALCRGET